MRAFSDMHCHMLPGVDDGAQDFKTACAMVDMAYADGIRRICFTPHRNPYSRNRDASGVSEAYKQICEHIASGSMAGQLSLYMGSEIMYYSGFDDDIKNGVCHTLCGGRHVLFEFSEDVGFYEISTAVRFASSLGYLPVIAHAERYGCIAESPELLYGLCESGALPQFNAALFLRRHGGFAKRIKSARIESFVLKHELPCLVATDAHDLVRRIPKLSEAYSIFCGKCSKEYADKIFFDMPSKIFLD